MPDPRTPWSLDLFLDRLDEWIALEQPSVDLSLVVMAWIMSRSETPYEGVRREEGFDGLWFGAIPGTLHEADQVVVCSYWIYERDHRVRCDSFASLSRPV